MSDYGNRSPRNHTDYDLKKPGPTILPPRPPFPPFIATPETSRAHPLHEGVLERDELPPNDALARTVRRETRLDNLESMRQAQSEIVRLSKKLAKSKEENEVLLKALDVLRTDLLAQLKSEIHHRLVALLEQKFADGVEAAVPGATLAGYLALCRYPYLQDESCKLPAGHISEHGPKHQCNIDCGLSDEGCTLPVPANPAAYFKALYWELHGGSCPPGCRGHAGG